jgi:GNAT superfamily N-acetyltransferase
MWWRKRTGDPAKNKRNLRGIVRADREPGLLAYDEGEPVGWVSIAPREEFGQLLTSRQYKPREPEEGVYSLVCFYVDPRAKRQGVQTALLAAALAHAKRKGARAVEAYAHMSDAGDYMGTVELFRDAGFESVRKSGKRTVMRFEP